MAPAAAGNLIVGDVATADSFTPALLAAFDQNQSPRPAGGAFFLGPEA